MSLTRVSVDNTSYNPAISADGSYIVFAGDTDGSRDIFVYDVEAEALTRISMGIDGVDADDDSDNPSISADGRYIAFASRANNLVGGDTNGDRDIFVYDSDTGQITRVSVDSLGDEANNDSDNPSISDDGNYITFRSQASNLVEGDTNARWDIFVYNRQTKDTNRVSVDSLGSQANNDSDNPSISGDGNYVAFASDASNLVEADTNSSKDIFVRNLTTGETTRVSVDNLGNQANGDSENSFISEDGRYITFSSDASNLIEGDTNNLRDVFVRDLTTGEINRVSLDTDGNEANGTSDNPVISADGRYIAFVSDASNLIEEDTNNTRDIFVRDLTTGETSIVSLSSDGSQGNDYSDAPDLSADGNYIAFISNANNLIADDTNVTEDVFIVNNFNDLPILANPIEDKTATEDIAFNFTIPENSFSDADGVNSLTFNVTAGDNLGLPSWLSFDAATTTFSGTPTNDDVGAVDIIVSVTDTEAEIVSDSFTLTVENTNDSPILINPIDDKTATEDIPFNFTIAENTFLDVDAGDSLTLSAVTGDDLGLPNWLSFDAPTSTFSGTPSNDDVGTVDIVVRAIDSEGESASDSFTLTVENTDEPPTVNQEPTIDDAVFNLEENSEENTQVGIVSVIDPENEALNLAIVSGNLDLDKDTNLAFAIDSSTKAITVNDSDDLDFETNSSFNLQVTATDAGGLSDTANITVNLEDVASTQFETENNNGFFSLNSGESRNIKFTLAGNDTEKVNELGLFTVDDENGTINGIAPDQEGYLTAALETAKVVFSAVSNRPNQFSLTDIERILEIDSDTNLGFYLIADGSTDTVLQQLAASGTTNLPLFFSNSSNLQVSNLGAENFNLNWSDRSNNSDFDDMQVVVELTQETPAIATQLQGEPQNESIDLRDIAGEVSVSVEVHREADFDNIVGFYQIADTNGGIDTDNDGLADINPGDAGYEQAALSNRISGLDLLQTENQQTSNFDGILNGGSLLASFIVVDGTMDQALNSSAEVYFSFLGANSDNTDRVRLLGDNIFGFEDLTGGGDGDFNDVIVKLEFT